MTTMQTTIRAAVTALLAVIALCGCTAGGWKNVHEDAGGLTQAEVAELSPREEYDLLRERYDHMQRLMRDAQLTVHDGTWEWGGGDDIPHAGGNGPVKMPGSTVTNSYDLASSRLWKPDGATGARRDLVPMIEYFTARGWKTYERDFGDDHDIRGVTGDGWQFIYTVQANGKYALDVYSESFWTNDGNALFRAVAGRSTMTVPDPSKPGEYPPFPTWDAPIVNPPKI